MNDESPQPPQPEQLPPQPEQQPPRPPRSRRRRLLLGLAWVTGGLVLLAAVGGGLLYWKLNRNLRTVDISGALGSDRPSASSSGAMDILVLGSEARMNTPAMPENNWTWRMAPDALTSQQAFGLAQLAELTDRDGWVEPPKA